MLSLLVLAGALAMLAPAAALATSAGDQQYVDPLGGSSSGSGSGSSQSGSSNPGSSSSGSSSAASSGSSSGSAVASSTPITTASSPTTTSTGSTSTTSAATLPFTGYAGWLSGGLGVLLLAAGLALRRVTRRA